jgi:hypothetical protein
MSPRFLRSFSSALATLTPFALLCLLSLSACLDPPKTDSLYSSYVLPATAIVPELEADEAAAKKLSLNASLGSFIPLRTGYFNGVEVKYWDFGALPALTLKPMYIFRYHSEGEDGDLIQDETHPNLIDSIPGDMAYTPLRQIFVVDFNTRLYRGERITSIRALEDAVDMGLVSSPKPADFFTNCLVAPSSVQMQVTDDDGQMVGPEITYYRGKIVRQFCVGDLYSKVGAIAQMDGKFKPGSAYSIHRRSDEDVLDETLLDIDLNDDGDLLDTNTIFNDDVGTKTYSGIWKSIEVEVDRNWKLGGAKQESDLFERDGDILTAKDKVLEFSDRGVFLNRPIRFLSP